MVLPESTVTVHLMSALSLENQFWFTTPAAKKLLLAEIQHKISGQGKVFKHFLEACLKQVLLDLHHIEDFLRFYYVKPEFIFKLTETKGYFETSPYFLSYIFW